MKSKKNKFGEIPEVWEPSIFSEAINVNPKRALAKGTDTKYVSMADLKEHDKKIQTLITRKYSGGSKFINGDTLMARITPCLENGKTAFVDILNKDEVGSGSTEFIVLSAKNDRTTEQFVYYLATSPQIREKAIQSMTGTSGRQRVETDVFDKIEIKLPNLDAQRAVAKILSNLDDKIELNHQMNKTLESIGQSIFKQWFVDFEFPVNFSSDINGIVETQNFASHYCFVETQNFASHYCFVETQNFASHYCFAKTQNFASLQEGYKSSGGKMVDSELGEIPVGWEVKPLDQIAEFLNGLAMQKFPPKDDIYLPVIKIRELNQGVTESSDKASQDIDHEKRISPSSIT